MKVIDVLQKIANGEKVRFRIDGKPYHCYKYDSLYDEEFEEEVEWFIGGEWLNKEVEIIEEEKKIPEKLDCCDENTFMFKCKENSYLTREEMRLLDSNFKELGNKINSIIDYLKSKGE